MVLNPTDPTPAESKRWFCIRSIRTLRSESFVLNPRVPTQRNRIIGSESHVSETSGSEFNGSESLGSAPAESKRWLRIPLIRRRRCRIDGSESRGSGTRGSESGTESHGPDTSGSESKVLNPKDPTPAESHGPETSGPVSSVLGSTGPRRPNRSDVYEI